MKCKCLSGSDTAQCLRKYRAVPGKNAQTHPHQDEQYQAVFFLSTSNRKRSLRGFPLLAKVNKFGSDITAETPDTNRQKRVSMPVSVLLAFANVIFNEIMYPLVSTLDRP